jgi:hypothetical protein
MRTKARHTKDLKETCGDKLPVDVMGATVRADGKGPEVCAGQTGKRWTTPLEIPQIRVRTGHGIAAAGGAFQRD